MGIYCSNCGRFNDVGSFCTNCGKRLEVVAVPQGSMNAPAPPPGSYPAMAVNPAYYAPPTPYAYPPSGPPGKARRIKQKKPMTPARRIVRISIGVIILLLIGTGIWYAGSTTGIWNNMALANAAEAWKKQPDYKQEAEAVKECLNALADALDGGNIEEALTYIDADKADQYRQLFYENESNLSNLVYALKNNEITFLSTAGEGYDAQRMATVKGKLPDTYSTASDQTGIIITMIKLDSGWVVASL